MPLVAVRKKRKEKKNVIYEVRGQHYRPACSANANAERGVHYIDANKNQHTHTLTHTHTHTLTHAQTHLHTHTHVHIYRK